MYHSTAVLIPDGSIVISGSNPNKDFTTRQWGSKTSVERWYPSWYNEPRPSLSQAPSSLAYGGDAWTHTWANTDETVAKNTKVVVLRGGFNTHAIAFGQRYLELTTTYEIDMNTGNTTLHIAQMPPNPALFQPGPAMLFLVVGGVPSVAEVRPIAFLHVPSADIAVHHGRIRQTWRTACCDRGLSSRVQRQGG